MTYSSKSLVTKIHEILDGELDASLAESVAKEYAKVASQTNSRVKQFVKLIREGCYYAAIDIANLQPSLVSQIENIRFPREREWLQYVENAGLVSFEGFNDNEVKRVKEVCADSSKGQPKEYREFRKAVLLKDKKGAIKVLRELFEAYPNDLNAKNELVRFEAELFEEESKALQKLLRLRKEPEIIEKVGDIIRQNWQIELSSEAWTESLKIYREDELKKLIEQILQYLSQIKVIERVGDWKDATPIIESIREIEAEKGLDFLEADQKKELADVFRWHQGCVEKEEIRQRLLKRLDDFKVHLEPETLIAEIEPLKRKGVRSYHAEVEKEWNYLKSNLEDAEDLASDVYQNAINILNKAIGEKKGGWKTSHLILTALVPVFVGIGIGLFYIHKHEGVLASHVTHYHMSQDLPKLEDEISTWETFTGRFLSRHNPVRNYDAHEKVEAAQSWMRDIGLRQNKINELLDKVEESLEVDQVTTADLRRIQLNVGIVEDLFSKLPASGHADVTERFKAIRKELNLIQMEKLGEIRKDLEASIDELEVMVQKRFSAAKSNFSNTEKELTEARDLINMIQLKFRRSFDEENLEDLRNIFSKKVGVIDEFERNYQSLDSNLSKISSSISLVEYLSYLKSMTDLPFRNHADVRLIGKARGYVPKFENLAQQLLLPGNPIAWRQFVRNSDQPLIPGSFENKEFAIYKRLARNEALKDVHRYRLIRYVDGVATDSNRFVYTLGKSRSRKDMSQTGGRLIQNIEQFDESKVGISVPFSDKLYVAEVSANGEPYSGDFLEYDRLTAESGFYNLLDELCGFNSETNRLGAPILEVLDEVKSNTFVSPILKAYITQELFNIMIVRVFDWGLNFSPSAQLEYRDLRNLTGTLYSYDWLRKNTRERLLPLLNNYYGELPKDSYHKQAIASRELFVQIARQRVRYAGYIDRDGEFNLLNSTPDDRKLFGMLKDETIGTLRIPATEESEAVFQEGIPYTPILFFNDPPNVILDRVSRKTDVDVNAPSFRPFLPGIYQ